LGIEVGPRGTSLSSDEMVLEREQGVRNGGGGGAKGCNSNKHVDELCKRKGIDTRTAGGKKRATDENLKVLHKTPPGDMGQVEKNKGVGTTTLLKRGGDSFCRPTHFSRGEGDR